MPVKLPFFYEEWLHDFSKCSVANKASPGNFNAVDISELFYAIMNLSLLVVNMFITKDS